MLIALLCAHRMSVKYHFEFPTIAENCKKLEVYSFCYILNKPIYFILHVVEHA